MALNTSEANLQTAPDQKLESNNVKNLSDLPDDILGHILSFMETRDAVRTSVLSKRWKYIREFSPTLVFDERRFFYISKDIDLWKYVGKEIHLRSFVKTFRFEVRFYPKRVAALLSYWITELVKRNVQDLYFDLRSSERFELPDCLFNCQSLVRFGLGIGGIGLCRVPHRPPSTMCLSSLKTLSLRRVDFLDEHSTNRFFSSLPALEDLTLIWCHWSDMEHVSISAPKLMRLTIYERGYVGTNSHGCRIAVYGPELTDFDYEGHFFNEPYLHDAKRLEKACISQGYVEPRRRYRLYRLLPCLSNVKYLELLCLDDYEVPKGEEGVLNDMPMFKNLTHLKIDGYFKGNPVLNANIGVMQLLNCSPRLEVLKASWVFHLPQDQEEIEPMPPCFCSHLKIIEVEISDEKKSYNALKSLLRNALVLQKVVVSIHNDCKKRNHWKRKILKLPRASQDCEVIVTCKFYM